MLDYKNDPVEERPNYYPSFYTFYTLTKESLDFITDKNIFTIFEYAGKKICLSHGSPYNVRDLVFEKNYELFDSLIEDYAADIYIFAHTHMSFVTNYKGALFLNLGSINLPCDLKCTTSFGIISIDDGNATYEKIDLPYEFSEVVDYYVKSEYYKACYSWTNLILNSLKSGIDHTYKFGNTYDNSLSYEENFEKYMKENSLQHF